MKTPSDIPALLIDRQLDALLDNFDRSLHEKGMELGLYLAHVKKTQDELRESWRPQAERQVRINLILRAVARAEKIEIDEKEADPEMKLREKIFSFLETHNAVV